MQLEVCITKHLGDITKLNGAEIPVVDCITGGSPCQDLSVAGKRAGMKHESHGDEETTRSGLFMDQIRLVKEMRANEMRSGRTGESVRPRYMVWENVPGAFSSGTTKGSDFAAVIEEIIKVAEPGACVCVCVPDKGWTKSGCYYADDGSWSIAWRTHDAQFWGVPQRRRRIALVADFNGLTAPSILFDYEYRGEAASPESYQTERDFGAEPRPEIQSERNGVSGDSAESGEARQGAPTGAESGVDSAICLQGNGIDRADTAECNGRGWRRGGSYTLNTIDRPAVYAENQGGRDGGGKGPLIQNDKSATLSTLQDQTLFVPNVSGTLNPGAHPGSYNGQDAYNDLLISTPPTSDRIDGRELHGISGERDADTTGKGLQRPADCGGFCPEVSERTRGIGWEKEKAPTLRAGATPGVLTSTS